MGETIPITDPDDSRVADFRCLNEQAARTKMETDEYFLSEGWMSIERLIDSGHTFRSVLLSPSRVTRFKPFMQRPELDGVAVYVAERDAPGASGRHADCLHSWTWYQRNQLKV